MSLVAIGVATGLSNLLRGLKHCLGAPEAVSSRGFGGYTLEDLTAIVSVADDGGSPGRLREEFDIPPPGDIDNCMVGLADEEKVLPCLFRYRFPGEGGLGCHNVRYSLTEPGETNGMDIVRRIISGTSWPISPTRYLISFLLGTGQFPKPRIRDTVLTVWAKYG